MNILIKLKYIIKTKRRNLNLIYSRVCFQMRQKIDSKCQIRSTVLLVVSYYLDNNNTIGLELLI